MKQRRSHYKDGGLKWGLSRNAGDTIPEVKTWVHELIVYYGQNAKYSDGKKAGLSGIPDEEIEKMLAIAEHESGFNPDAASQTTTASGIFQITVDTADDAERRLNGKWPANYIQMDIQAFEKFDPHSNIKYGILIYFDKKRKARSNDIKEIYKEYNPKASPEVLNRVYYLYERKYKGTVSRMNISLVRPDRNWPIQVEPSEDKYWDALHRFNDEVTNRYADILNNRRG